MTTLVLALIVVAVQTATGAVWWRLARGTSVRVLEVLGMGLALGTAAATMSGLLLFSVLPVRIAWAVPSIVTAIALPWVWARHRAVLTSMRPTRWAPALVALVIGGAAGLGSIAINLRNYPLAADSPTTTYHPDMLFFEALSTSLARLGPSDSILMAGAELRYHWFTYAWSGQLAATVGAEPFVVLTRVLPVVSLIGTLLIAIAWTQRMTRGRWAPTLAVVLLVAGGYVGATYGTILHF
ncbi:MAG: hypothetical protein NTX29_05140, partial [Actinobacteria bacterium]|nr:hypothetical protein [Actinomycetota bacterium]